MAFNIKEFSSQINTLGVAQSNLFVSLLSPPAGLNGKITAQELRFLCRTVDVPEMAVATTDFRPMGMGAFERRPTSFTYSPFNAVFIVDSKFRVLNFFHAWMQTIVNYDAQGGPASTSRTGARLYEFGFKEDYVSNMSVVIFSSPVDDSSLTYTYTFGNIFPINIGNITVAWENEAELLLLPVTFTFDTLVVDGAQKGTVQDNVLPSSMLSEGFDASEIQTTANSFAERLGNIYDRWSLPYGGQSLILNNDR